MIIIKFKIEDYKVFISQYTDNSVEIEIIRNGKFVCGSYTVDILQMSNVINRIIKDNEIKEFGYVRMKL